MIGNSNGRAVTLEEHYMSPAFAKGPGAQVLRMVESMGLAGVVERITELGSGRIAEMDAKVRLRESSGLRARSRGPFLPDAQAHGIWP